LVLREPTELGAGVVGDRVVGARVLGAIVEGADEAGVCVERASVLVDVVVGDRVV
jgi:hypothetical protein